jgi:hypothetical protein
MAAARGLIDNASMRFSLFDLLAWITVLAVLCALVINGPLGEKNEPGPILLAWVPAVVVVQKCFRWPVPLIVSLFIGISVSVVRCLIEYFTRGFAELVHFSILTAVLIDFAMFAFFGALVWAAVAAADYLIRLAKHRINRAD